MDRLSQIVINRTARLFISLGRLLVIAVIQIGVSSRVAAMQSETIMPTIGLWSGMTSQGKSIKFSVTDRGLTDGSSDIFLNFGNCTVSAHVEITGSDPVLIADSKFSASNSVAIGDIGTLYSDVKGSFDSNTSSSGTMNIQLVSSSCKGSSDGTWKATWLGPLPTSTPTLTPSLTLTPSVTLTPTDTITPTATSTFKACLPPKPPSNTPRVSRTPSSTPSLTATATITPIPCNTITPTNTRTSTHTPTPSRTPKPSNTPKP